MTTETTPGNVPLTEELGLAAGAPKPRAWAIFTDSGNARMWTTFQPHIQKLADAEGLEVVSLYDRFAIKQAVAAERARCATALRIAREGYASEAVTGLPVLPQWRERALALIDKALKA